SNAGAHLLPEAGARHERTLEAVRCSGLLGLVVGSGTQEGLFCPGLCVPLPAHFGSVALPNTLPPQTRLAPTLRARGPTPIRWWPEQSQGHPLSVGNAWGARLACYGRFFRSF